MRAKNVQRSEFRLKSHVFTDGVLIPKSYTCNGGNVSPPLEWTEPMPGVKSYALVCEDPDSPFGLFTHWIIYNIPGGLTKLQEGLEQKPVLPGEIYQGMNDFKFYGYGGPCPKSGTHRYVFKIYALSVHLPFRKRTSKTDFLEDIDSHGQRHILAEATLTGKYRQEGRPGADPGPPGE